MFISVNKINEGFKICPQFKQYEITFSSLSPHPPSYSLPEPPSHPPDFIRHAWLRLKNAYGPKIIEYI